MNDLTGKRFNRLKVVSLAYTKRVCYWNCICDCGNEVVVRGTHLSYGNVQSCGCYSRDLAKSRKGNKHPRFKDLTGIKFNCLTVIKREEGKDSHRVYWLCECDCGNTTIVEASKLKSGHTTSCGCNQIKRRENHWNWQGGKLKNRDGYIEILLENDDKYYSMANNKGYVLEHRLVKSKQINRLLTENEFVHHLNGEKDDNDPKNLELVNGHTHALITKLETKIKRLEMVII